MALGVAGYPVLVYHIAECCCHLGLAASVFLTIAITIERYQVQGYQMYQDTKYEIAKKPRIRCRDTAYQVPSTKHKVPGARIYKMYQLQG